MLVWTTGQNLGYFRFSSWLEPHSIHYTRTGMLKLRPAGMRPRPENIFEADATMYGAEAKGRHVREQLLVYEL